MKFWYDSEFHDLTGTSGVAHVVPISIGIVAEDGRELYEVCDWFDYEAVAADPWLAANVIANLEKPREEWLSRRDLAQKIEKFFAVSDGKTNEMWAWYSAYDPVVLTGILGGFGRYSRAVPSITMDLRQEHLRWGEPHLPRDKNTNEHNALYDARECRDMYMALRERAVRYPQTRKPL